MFRKFVGSALVLMLSLAASFAHSEQRRGGGERSEGERSNEQRSGGDRSRGQSSTGRKPPGGAWSEYSPEGSRGGQQTGRGQSESGAKGAAAGAAHSNRNSPQASGAEGAAAGAARSNRNNPQASGAEGAAAGAAAANRNDPKHSGAQGAAAGAAAANRNDPKYSGAQGAAAGAAVANNNAPQYSGAAGAAAGYAAVRNNVDHPGMYSQQWYGEHQGAWAPTGLSSAAVWATPTWNSVAGQIGSDPNATPVTYNYGSNVTCIDNKVVVDGQPVGTAEEFSQQADEIAEHGMNAATTSDDKWMPLGVFALVRNEQQHPQLIMQLAVNQNGILRGNYTDEVTDSTLPVRGAIDPKTQRAAWTVGNNKFSVMEAGLNNLTQGEAQALIHKNGTTQKWLLVRLSQASRGDAPK